MPNIKASVGIANGRQCYNTVDDQLVVINMLNQLPGFSGGTADNPLDTSPRWGICSGALYQAILNFQARYSCAQDGHIDPGGRTIRALSAAIGDQLPLAPDPGSQTTGPAAVNTMGVADTLWTVDNVSLGSIGAVDTVGANGYWGDITFSQSSVAPVTYPIKGFGPAAGVSASDLPKVDGSTAGALAAQAAKWLADNAGFSAESFKSIAGGVCVPFGSDLGPNSFTGACIGGTIAGNILAGGGSLWALFFGMPRLAIGGVALSELFFGTALLAPVGLATLAVSLYQARGVALFASAGLQVSAAGGVSFTQFFGEIG